MDSSVEKIRNISQTGMKNRRNIGLFLFLIAILCVIFFPLDSQSVLGISGHENKRKSESPPLPPKNFPER